MSPIREVGSNQLQNSPIEIIGLIDQILKAYEEAMAGLKQDSEILVTQLIDITNGIQPFGKLENMVGCIQQLKTLALDQRNCEQARREQISKRVSLIQRNLEAIRTGASMDALTQVANLNSFNCTLPRWIASHEKSGVPFTIAFLDLDNCRQINESFGRPIGDRILAFIAMEIARNIRERDFLARYSGDEFAVLSPGMKLTTAAKRFSKLLQHLETKNFEYSSDREHPIVTFTVSCGIAEYAIGESAEELIDRAQNALRDAKKLGKNRVATRIKFLLNDRFDQGLAFPGSAGVSPASGCFSVISEKMV
jgi:diguanylate cyclase (GGDEF)-like protein